MAQAADNLPLYGVCCYMDEMVHRPPAILGPAFPECSSVALSRYLVAAPRCYCFLTHFPFFTLHMKVRLEPLFTCRTVSDPNFLVQAMLTDVDVATHEQFPLDFTRSVKRRISRFAGGNWVRLVLHRRFCT